MPFFFYVSTVKMSELGRAVARLVVELFFGFEPVSCFYRVLSQCHRINDLHYAHPKRMG